MKQPELKGSAGLGEVAAWAIHHPVGVVMIAMALLVVGIFSLSRLPVDLLPHLIYPEIRVRILDPGVATKVMEDSVTRQLEEQLAIVEDAISVRSRTVEGAVSVDLAFPYGKDIDIALRDTSTRLDRAKRFLPDTIRPPIIYKLDPAQIPVMEFVVSNPLGDPVALRDWVDYDLSRWFLNLPGVAAVEVGGGMRREIQVIPDPARLAGLGLSAADLADTLNEGHVEQSAGRVETLGREYAGRTTGRFTSMAQIEAMPVTLPDRSIVPLSQLAEVVDGHEDARLRTRLDGQPGVKMTIQKQPTANTVEVAEQVKARFAWLAEQGVLGGEHHVRTVADQSVYIRDALNNATQAALNGAMLAMLVVYLFLGNLRRALIIGAAIPLSVVVTFILMGGFGLTLNIMTLGGLALGVGMVVDSAIVMLENIHRHQREGEPGLQAGVHAAREVGSAIIASTSTNLAAIIPFLFISGLIGLLFKELIFTIVSAIVAAMVVALTLAPTLAARVPSHKKPSAVRRAIDAVMHALQRGYAALLHWILHYRTVQLVILASLGSLLALAAPVLLEGKQIFLPAMDDGRVRVSISADPGTPIDVMDRSVQRIEKLLAQQQEVHTVFSIVGGYIFGRSERQVSNRTSMVVQMVPLAERAISNDAWIKKMRGAIGKLKMAGIKVRMRSGNIRGVRISRGDDDLTLRIAGSDQRTMEQVADRLSTELRSIKGLRNITHSAEEKRQELVIQIDHARTAALGLTAEEVAEAAQIALNGVVVTQYVKGDRSHDIRLRLPKSGHGNVAKLNSVLVSADPDRGPIYLSEVAQIELAAAPAEILRDNQRRMVEVTASITAESSLSEVSTAVDGILATLPRPKQVAIYDGGAGKALQESKHLTTLLLGLALFLVFVVMSVQYESLRNPLIILLSVPFTIIGVAGAVTWLKLPISMPLWLGLIMLAGIVVNNAIVLVEYMEILRRRGTERMAAIVQAGRVRLRPVLMTTLTTVAGLTPLAMGAGEGSEMLRPLAITIVFGLSSSMLVTLLVIPIFYSLFSRRD
uniref:Putative multi-drug efflux transporter AcrB/AcrD/AcrF family homolog n=1 Tax=Magnetococcus massalia (strain MO-1) TaxID=451514 RepID=A0A1S7LEX4_MAGMO|nr:putative multi-drug efflux transporter AcrB/AcrD/AcrF family homolog [Candidatus Magnetococcus massalia]